MAFKESLSTWASATDAWDKGDSQASLKFLTGIPDPNSKILFNIGSAYKYLDDLENALKFFSDAISKDGHMAIAYFERGCVSYKAKRYGNAIEDFLACQSRFRSRSVIDYSQLGLKYKLYLCEAQYNVGVSETRLGDFNSAEKNIESACKSKVELRHRYMKDALQAVKKRELPDLAEIPRDAIYRPPKGKVDNMEKRDYLGKATVISAVNQKDGYSGFVGPKMLEGKKMMPSSDPTKSVVGNQKPIPVRSKGTLEQLVVNSLSLSPKEVGQNGSSNPLLASSAPTSPKGRPKLKRQGSKDDCLINGKPELPPRRLESRGNATESLFSNRTSTSRHLPPPPNRPPPKLDRKPLPPEPGRNPAAS